MLLPYFVLHLSNTMSVAHKAGSQRIIFHPLSYKSLYFVLFLCGKIVHYWFNLQKTVFYDCPCVIYFWHLWPIRPVESIVANRDTANYSDFIFNLYSFHFCFLYCIFCFLSSASLFFSLDDCTTAPTRFSWWITSVTHSVLWPRGSCFVCVLLWTVSFFEFIIR